MANINPFPEAPWFSIDEDQYLMYLLKGYEINLSDSKGYVYFSLDRKYHRDDGPAVIWESGLSHWFHNGDHIKDEQLYLISRPARHRYSFYFKRDTHQSLISLIGSILPPRNNSEYFIYQIARTAYVSGDYYVFYLCNESRKQSNH